MNYVWECGQSLPSFIWQPGPKPSQTLKFINTFEILAFKLFSICASFNMSKVNISLCLTLDVGTP